MPRITLPTPDQMNEDQLKVFNKMITGPRGKVQGPIRAAIHNAELADRWQALGALLRYNTSLTPRLSEIAILVTAKASQSPFEWYAHRIEAEKIGLEKDIIENILQLKKSPLMSKEEATTFDFAFQLCQTKSVSNSTYALALNLFGEKTIVELTALVGYYTMVAMTLNAHEIPLPQGITPAFALPQENPAS